MSVNILSITKYHKNTKLLTMDYYLRSDCILREILEDRKSLTGFLDAVFGFMSRNTDFYHVQNTKDDKLGFPRGVKEQILMSCMQKYEHAEKANLLTNVTEDPSFVAEEVEVVTDESNRSHYVAEVIENPKSKACSLNDKIFIDSDYRNGSLFENYCWSQTLKDVELNILLPNVIKLGKHVKVYLQPKLITIKTLIPTEELLISGEIWDKCRHDDVIWSISDGKLLLSFDKVKQCWWEKLFVNEIPIDIKTVDTERSIDKYSPDVQNAIEKINTQRSSEHDLKTLPLNERGQMNRLRQAWNAEDSPFKGIAFDPSLVQFN